MTPSPEKRLFLLRHAKSSWDDPQLTDHDRPLAPRGRRAAKAMAKYLSREHIAPEIVLCSSALRARETLDLISLDTRVLIEADLYGASSDELLDRLRQLAEATPAAMLIGHNPAMQDLALKLARPGPARAVLEGKYPTAGLASLAFEARWSDLDAGGADLVGFVTPKTLRDPT